MSFSGKVVIVTGASSGIGASTAVKLCGEGASVALVGRNKAKMAAAGARCAAAGGRHLLINADVAKDDDAKRIVNETLKQFGKLDVLVNNAAVMLADDVSDGSVLTSFDKQVGSNLRAVIHLTTLAVPYLKETKGNIINISSSLGLKMAPGLISYGLLKAALNHFTRGAALELAASGVRVNTLSPGPVATDLLVNGGHTVDEKDMANITALKRISESEEIAELILFLASEKARGITGSNFVSDNGFTIT